eukprot:TRINITY_DN12509_c0_g1_i1.p1 TRINITY_DN12509_c0_g1~~TRINITY_DN12509_c0_g1_i1.p1  ORF type:complete len:120 (+),score=11.52 TRINITY_DN12509_c0_g1_i1:2-361(+)
MRKAKGETKVELTASMLEDSIKASLMNREKCAWPTSHNSNRPKSEKGPGERYSRPNFGKLAQAKYSQMFLLKLIAIGEASYMTFLGEVKGSFIISPFFLIFDPDLSDFNKGLIPVEIPQ